MPVALLMPALSPTMTEGNIAKWIKKVGDEVVSGDIIAEVETDKATMEVEAIDEGKLASIIYPDGSVQKKVGIGKQQVFMEKIKFGENKSLYSIYGDIIAIVCFLVTTLFVGYICKKQYYS